MQFRAMIHPCDSFVSSAFDDILFAFVCWTFTPAVWDTIYGNNLSSVQDQFLCVPSVSLGRHVRKLYHPPPEHDIIIIMLQNTQRAGRLAISIVTALFTCTHLH